MYSDIGEIIANGQVRGCQWGQQLTDVWPKKQYLTDNWPKNQ